MSYLYDVFSKIAPHCTPVYAEQRALERTL